MGREYRKILEEGSNVAALEAFGEILDDAAERFQENYGEELDVIYRGPAAHTFPGPAAGTSVSNHSDYIIEGYDRAQKMSVKVTDKPYHVDDIIIEDGVFNFSNLRESLEGFKPEKTRSRLVKLSPEEGLEEDLWFCFTREVENVVEPERFESFNEDDYLYFFDLEDTT